ncbi:MAG: DNA polymerase Y family protein [Pirellulaceae bacterium]
MTQRVLSIWLPNWPIQRLLAVDNKLDEPERPPLVLVARDPRRGPRVVACCRRAAAVGIRVNMSGGEAESLLQVATDGRGITQPHDAQADMEALQELASACAHRFSPIVAIEPMGSRRWAGQWLHLPQGLLLDVTGIEPLFGTEQNLCREVDLFFQSRNLQPRLALACTIAAAWGLSRTAATRPLARRDDKSPSNEAYRITQPEDEFHHLLAMPTRAMRLEPACVDMLARLGIETFGQLIRLPRQGLATRLGPELILRIDQLLGHVGEPLQADPHRPDDTVHLDLDYPTRDKDILQYTISQLIEQLTKNLKQRVHGALRVVCRLELLQHEAVEIRLGLFAPTADADHLTHLMTERFSQQRLVADVHRVSICAPLTALLRQRQPSLIADAEAEVTSSHALANLIDNLAARLGRQSVLKVQTVNNPQPEAAFRLQPLTGQPIGEISRLRNRRRKGGTNRSSPSRKQMSSDQAASSASDASSGNEASRLTEASADTRFLPSPRDPLRRPLRLFNQPIALKVLKTEDAGPPTRFVYRGTHVQTVRSWGPERIETAWWSGPSVRRDYYRIETQQGDWLWVFRKLTTDQWFLHGLFG